VSSELDDHEELEKIFNEVYKEHRENKERAVPVGHKRARMLYDHLFDILERAIFKSDINDTDELCRLVETFDQLYAIGVSMEWLNEEEE
jgi:hypothetical protein